MDPKASMPPIAPLRLTFMRTLLKDDSHERTLCVINFLMRLLRTSPSHHDSIIVCLCADLAIILHRPRYVCRRRLLNAIKLAECHLVSRAARWFMLSNRYIA